MADKLAILGGSPAFEKTFPIIRPSADEAATPELSKRMQAVLQSNMLSNVGIYVRKLEEELERKLQVDHVIATSSCTLGLILVLQALGPEANVSPSPRSRSTRPVWHVTGPGINSTMSMWLR